MFELVLVATVALNIDTSIGAAEAFDKICRGSNEPTSQTTTYACKRRDEVFNALSDAGWCYGSSIVDHKWHKCTETDKKLYQQK